MPGLRDRRSRRRELLPPGRSRGARGRRAGLGPGGGRPGRAHPPGHGGRRLPLRGTRSKASRRQQGGSARTRSSARPASGRARSARSPGSTSQSRASHAGCTSRPRTEGSRSAFPLTIDFSTGFYFHRRGPGLVFGGREPDARGAWQAHATRRLPVLAELPIQSSWWGYYEMSPDHNAIVGEAAEPSRFLYATGFSGHGFQQSPAVGEHLAELVAGRKPTLDLSSLSLDRFAEGRRARGALRGLASEACGSSSSSGTRSPRSTSSGG